jgi:hypothetical protein
MKLYSSQSSTTLLRALALSASLAATAAGCGSEDEDPQTGGSVGGAGASPGVGGGSAGAGSAGGGSAGGGAPGGAASTDTPWCKAKAVFDARCVSCHDGARTAGAPMALKTIADLTAESEQYPGTKVFTRALARMKATTSPMPPEGGAKPAEIQAVESWVQGGAEAGASPTCAGASAGSASGGGAASGGTAQPWPADCENFYKITAHDMADASKPYRMPRNTENHPGFTFDAPWGSEEVQALAFRPITDNKKILHHWILYQNGAARAFISGWAPGQDEADRAPLPPDVGMYLPSGARSLYLDMHYYNLGADSSEELDASGVEICTVSKAKFRANTASVFMGFVGIGAPMVPANAVNHNVTANCNVTASEPVHLLTASPHAHKFATHMKFTATVGGEQIIMHDLPFNFEEQRSRRLPQEVVLNTGDKVTTTCTYTNTTSRNINFSENTDGEMCFNFALYYPKGALSCSGGGFGGLFGGGR